MDTGVEGVRAAAHRLETHRGGGVRRAPQCPGVADQQRRQPRLGLRPVYEREPLFRLERNCFQTLCRQRSSIVSFPDHRQRKVRERREVTGGAHTPLRRDVRVNAAVQHLGQQLGQHRPHATGAAHQHVGAEQHHRAHGFDVQRIADAGCVAADQIELELPGLLGRDPHMSELSKTGVHAVDRLAARNRGFDRLSRLANGLEHFLVERNGHVAPGHGDDVRDGERPAVEGDCPRHGDKS